MKKFVAVSLAFFVLYLNFSLAVDKPKNFVELSSGTSDIKNIVQMVSEKNLTADILHTILSDINKIQNSEVISAVKQLKEYKKSQRIKKVSSKQGLIYDSDWIDQGNFQDCKPVKTGTTSSSTTQVIPGTSLGVQDETIVTTTFTKIEFVKNVCETHTPTAISIQIPLVSNILPPISNAALATGFINKFELTVNGTITDVKGDDCCIDCNATPVNYDEYAGSGSLEATIGFNIPGWSWTIPSTKIQGIYAFSGSVVLGPIVTYTASGIIGASGKVYQNNQCNSCYKLFVSEGVKLKVELGGTATGLLVVFPGKKYQYQINPTFEAKAGVSTGIEAKGQWSTGNCPAPGLSGSLSWGGLSGHAVATIKVFGVSLSVTKQITIFKGGSINF